MSEGRASRRISNSSTPRNASEATDAPTGVSAEWSAGAVLHLPMPLAVVDREGRLIGFNPAWTQWVAEVGPTPYGEGASYGEFLKELARKGIAKTEPLSEHFSALRRGVTSEFRLEISCALERRSHFLVTGKPLGALEEGRFLLIHEDRSALHHTEQELREGHALFLHVINQSRDAIFLYDVANRLVLANEIFLRALNVKLADVIGKNIFELFDPDLARIIQEQNILVITSGQDLNFEMTFDNQPVIVRKGIYRNHRNEVAGVYCIAYESSKENVREALERSQQHFRALIESNANRVSLIDKEGIITYASPASQRMIGFTLEEQIGSNSFLWLHPQDLPEFMKRFRQLLHAPGSAITSEYRTLCKDGRWAWMEATHTNLLEDLNVRAIVVNERDITERKEAEVELTRYAQIIQSSSEAIFSSDLDGHILSWNPAAAKIFGYHRADVLGRLGSSLVPEEHRKRYRSHRKETLKGNAVSGLELEMLRKDGSIIHALMTLSPIRGRDGQIIGIAKVVRDVTERRRLERQILEISDRERQLLGQDLHDDLCQQLIGIGMVSRMLHQEMEKKGVPLRGEVQRIVQLADQAVDNARRLARGLCPLHLSGTGFMHALELLVDNTVQIFRAPCRFVCPEPVSIDEESLAIHLYRITQEALHNAVKHSDASKIEVRLERDDKGIEITVSDNGLGLQPNNRLREDHSGLGMHTMQYRAQILGATLTYSENPGGGTLVHCRVPVKPEA